MLVAVMTTEYKVEAFDAKGIFSRKFDTSSIESRLNELSREGWEVLRVSEVLQELGTTSGFVVFLTRASKS